VSRRLISSSAERSHKYFIALLVIGSDSRMRNFYMALLLLSLCGFEADQLVDIFI
jgi:hypothetical protein